MKEEKIWVCQTDRSHVFKSPTDDGYCPLCPMWVGLLKPEIRSVPGPGTGTGNSTGGSGPYPIPTQQEVGLCVILMDASASMTDPVFEEDTETKISLVAKSAAEGIFDLERLHNNQNAIIAAFKFDDRVEKMFVKSVGALIKDYNNDVNQFSDYLYAQLFKMQRGTDINKALRVAHEYVGNFLQNRLNDFPVKNYTSMQQRILKAQSVDSISVPNVRVLIYTDGRQFVENGEKQLKANPFIQSPLPGLNHDVVIGAFLGKLKDDGCNELKGLLSECPRHDTTQFFLLDTHEKTRYLKHLFRMASGASGFCPMCLSQQLRG
jgi:hypothetical protein